MTALVHFDQDEAREKLNYDLICSTVHGSKWNTYTRKRLYRSIFTKEEQLVCKRIFRKAHIFSLTSGIPSKGVTMNASTYRLWVRLAAFCAEL